MGSKVTVLTPQEVELHALADQVIAHMRDLCETISSSFLRLGAVLRLVQQHELWKVKGYESFDAFISDPDNNRGLHRRHLFRSLRAARTYLPEGGAEPPVPLVDVARIGIIKADLIAPLITNATPAQRVELVAQAETLTVRDLTRRLRTDQRVQQHPGFQEADQRERLVARIHGLADQLMAADDAGAVLAEIIRVCAEERLRLTDLSTMDKTVSA